MHVSVIMLGLGSTLGVGGVAHVTCGASANGYTLQLVWEKC